jgi:hypothetical protein
MQNHELINISDRYNTIEYIGHELNEGNATLLAGAIRRLVASPPKRTFSLLLNEVKSIEINAARVLGELSEELSEIEVDADFPYIFNFTEFGFEHLPEDVAQILAKFPSYFLNFDKITHLPESVACQFNGSGHALTFCGCSEFSPATLRALAKSACFLSLGLSELSVEQAKELANLHGDLLLNRAKQLPSEVLLALGEKPNLCLRTKA